MINILNNKRLNKGTFNTEYSGGFGSMSPPPISLS